MAQRTGRTWIERITILALIGAAVASFATAGVLGFGQWALSQGQLVALEPPTGASPAGPRPVDVSTVGDPGLGGDDEEVPLVLAEPEAANFLITGVDNGECATGGDSVIEDRRAIGSRTDTIMIWRANPKNDQLAILSLPRDLYLDIAGGRKGRINAAYEHNDPTRLIETIWMNFGIPVDHYIQVDICAFRQLVDAVGGVQVPFEYPTRDVKAHLDIPEAGCINLDGEDALAYVRARHFQQEIPAGSGNWKSDPTSDFGRIARQQDFLRRVIRKVIREGLYDPQVAGALIAANRDNVVRDTGLTLRRMLEFSNTLRRLDPATIATYRIESRPATLSTGAQILYPVLGGENMQAILAVFRGEATLAAAPEQVGDTTTTLAGIPSSDTTTPTTGEPGAATTPAESTIPVVAPEGNVQGVVPPDLSSCD